MHLSFQQLSSEPDHVLMFCTSRLYETPVSLPSSHPTRFPRNAKCEAVEVTSFVEKLLPKICPMFALVADGVVGLYIFELLGALI